MSRGASLRGIQRERDYLHLLQADGWWAMRAPASKGAVDIVAAKPGVLHFIEMKSTSAGPFSGFGPADRAELLATASLAGAEPFLVWWPPRAKPRVIPPSEWPRARRV